MNVPIFRDVNTPNPFVEKYPDSIFPEGADGALPDHVYMDCMCFGMGCSCLQVTFQACNIDEARRLYDQLAPLAPLMVNLLSSFPSHQ
jgi:glutamate--cysteine ligase catalytic subunit